MLHNWCADHRSPVSDPKKSAVIRATEYFSLRFDDSCTSYCNFVVGAQGVQSTDHCFKTKRI